METPVNMSIAIVGISVEIPGGPSASTNLDNDTFFKFLLKKGQSYTKVPSDRFNIDSWHGLNPGQIFTDTGSFLKDVTLFDNFEFGISQKDARCMSLSTRKLVEHAFLSLWDSGISYRRQNIGCYMSGTAFDLLSVADHNEYDATGSLSGAPSMIANAVSYYLDLCGPSIPVDTACSSSATALHLAVQAIRSGDCEAALVGGCQINHRFVDFVEYSQASILSPDGKCKPFDSSANGFSRGEGVAVVVLKPLAQAIKDGDFVYASILGTAVNSTGSAAPVHAPVPASQEAAMRRAFAQASRFPTEVDYVELHATGTAVGDPLEANWVGNAFKRDDELLIGSVKGNIGHTEIAAFLSSLSKVCSIFQNKLIPPNVNLTKLNPKIKWDEYRLRVPTETTPIEPRHPLGRFLVSLNSSGIGGSNAHVVVESFPNPPYITSQPNLPVLVVAGGLSSRSTSAIADSLAELLPGCKDASQISVAYGRRSLQTTWRSFAVFKPDTPLTFSRPRFISKKRPPLVFVMSGQGPQHINMGRQLFEQSPVFRDSILELDSHYKRIAGHSIIERTGLFGHSANPEKLHTIWPIQITLPALAMVQMAMLDLLRSVGIVPNVVVGHSAGETALLYASGAAPKELVLEIAIARGMSLASVQNDGGCMAAFPCSPEVGHSIITKLKCAGYESVELACYNAVEAVTLAGLEEEMEKAIEVAREMGIKAQKLRTRVAVHGAMMERCRALYMSQVAAAFEHFPGVHSPDPSIITFSTVYAREWREPFSSEYLYTNTRSPVLFTQTVANIKQNWPEAAFLEISPHPVLSQYLSSDISSESVLCPMKRSKVDLPGNEYTWFLEAVGGLAVLGYKVDYLKLNHANTFPHSAPSLPYPFTKKSVPFYPETSSFIHRQFDHRNGPLNFTGIRVSTITYPDLAEHVINSQPIMPAAGFLEMAFEFGAKFLWNVKFTSMLPLLSEKTIALEVTQNNAYWSVKSSPPGTSEAASRLHAEGYLSLDPTTQHFEQLDIDAIKQQCEPPVDAEGFYKSINHFAQYGPSFRRTLKLFIGKDGNTALTEVRGFRAELDTHARPYVLNPVILDACFHVMLHPTFTCARDTNVYYLPSAIESVILHTPLHRSVDVLYVQGILHKWSPEEILFDLVVADRSGARICTFLNFSAARHEKVQASDSPNRISYDLAYQPISIPPLPLTKPSNPGSDKLLGLDDNQPKSYLDSPESLHNHPGRCIAQTIDHIVYNANKRVVRILDIGIGISHILSDEKLCDVLEWHHSQGIVIHYTRCGASSHPDTPKSTSVVVEHRKAGYFDTVYPQLTLFDLVITSSASSTVDDIPKYLTSLPSLLVPGGCLIISSGGWHLSDEVKESVEQSDWFTVIKGTPHFSASMSSSDEVPFTVIAQMQPLQLQLPQVLQKDVQVHEFTLDISSLQSVIQKVNELGSQLWITTNSDCGFAAGFVRAIRQEMTDLDIRLASFDKTWSKKQRFAFVQRLASVPGVESEVHITPTGEILVPRCVPMVVGSQSSDTASFGRIGENLVTHYLDEVCVEVLRSFPTSTGLSGVVGKVIVAPESQNVKESDLVLGLTIHDPSSPKFSLHPSSVIPISDKDMASFAPFASPMFVAFMAVGFGYIRNPESLRGKRVVVTTEDSLLAETLVRIFAYFHARVDRVDITPTPETLQILRRSDLVICASTSPSDIQIIRSVIGHHAMLVPLGDPSNGILAQYKRDPWIVKEMLPELRRLYYTSLHTVLCDVQIPAKNTGRVRYSLFRPDRAYILVGGIGALGLGIALWMYENGARQLYLTSRSGKATLLRPDNLRALRISQYLETLEDLTLMMVACDASSLQQMSLLLHSISLPFGGIMLLSLVLNDRLFPSHTQESFQGSLAAKAGALEVVEALVPIESLEFLIALSSVTSFGSAGQSSYGSGNTAVEWRLREYRNAFSLISPGILDSRMFVEHDGRYAAWEDWSVTTREICQCIADGLEKMRQAKLSLYIPDLKWHRAMQQLGSTQLFEHFISGDEGAASVSKTLDRRAEIRQVTGKLLDVKLDDLSDETPLTSYGLDSLLAGKLAFALKPFVQISQLELLADLPLNGVYTRMKKETSVTKQTTTSFSWDALNQPGQTVVKLVEGEGTPLILLHGGDSNILPFAPLQDRFSSSLWAIQVTPETPITTVEEIAKFYYDRIKEELPNGPYRIGGFSGSALIAYELAFLFESSGDDVAQFVNLDLPPTVYTPPMFRWDNESVELGCPSQELLRDIIGLVTSLTDADPGSGPVRYRISRELVDAHDGLPVPDSIRQFYGYIRDGMSVQVVELFSQLAKNAGTELGSIMNDSNVLQSLLFNWTRRVSAKLQIILPANGITRVVGERGLDPVVSLRVMELSENVEVVVLKDAGHFTMFESDEMVELLENGWKHK